MEGTESDAIDSDSTSDDGSGNSDVHEIAVSKQRKPRLRRAAAKQAATAIAASAGTPDDAGDSSGDETASDGQDPDFAAAEGIAMRRSDAEASDLDDSDGSDDGAGNKSCCCFHVAVHRFKSFIIFS